MVYIVVAVLMITLFWWTGKGYLIGYLQPFRWAFAGMAHQLVWQVIPLLSADSVSPMREISLAVVALLGGGLAWLYVRPGLGSVIYLTVLQLLFLLMGLLTLLATGNLLGLLPVGVVLFVVGCLIVGYRRLKQIQQPAAPSLEQ